MDISAMDPKEIPELFDAEVVGSDGEKVGTIQQIFACLLYTSPSPRDS